MIYSQDETHDWAKRAVLLEQAPAMLALLRELEFSANACDTHEPVICPCCHYSTHEPDCKLAAILEACRGV